MYKQFLMLVLIVANISLFVAQDNTKYENDRSGNEDTETEEDKFYIRCKNTLPVIINGKFILESAKTAIYKCNDNFLHAWPAQNIYFCSEGEWDLSDLPECLPVCDNENWDSSWKKCVPDCGLRNHPDALLTSNKLQLEDFPHHVGIYFKLKTKDKNDFKYICGGSIISVRLIATAMYCITFPITRKEISLDLFDVFVAAGKFYSDYESPLDTNVQKRQVTNIEFNEPGGLILRDDTMEYFNNIVILVIDEPFIFDNFVQPVCLDWSGWNVNSFNGYVVGWGDKKYKASNNLNARLVTALNKREKYVTSTTICTNPDQGCDICVGDIGSGLVTAKNTNGTTKYYIQNIVNGKGLDKKICGGTTTTEYIDFFRAAIFLYSKLIKYPNIVIVNGSSVLRRPKSCKVPFIPSGRLLISRKPYTSQKPIPNHSVVYIECNSDTYLYPSFPEYLICWDGKFNRELPKCSRTCPPLKSHTIEFICELNGVITDCTSPSLEGTIATMLCITNHWNVISDDQYTTAVCIDGVWNQPFLTCEPKCTRSAKISQVYIFQKISNDPKGKYICGGSILSDNIILSAAQCFTNESNGELLNLESFFLHPYQNENSTRKFLEVKIPQEYKGKLSNFTGNLAIIKLDKPLLLNTARIGVSCFEEPLNYLEELKHANFRNGRITGKYFYQVHNSSVINTFNESIFIDYLKIDAYNLTECIYDGTKEMDTNDKFCAGKIFFRTGDSKIVFPGGNPVVITNIHTYSSICFKSPGAGYFTAGNGEDGRVFLQGVASFRTLDKCIEEEEKYLFTALEKYHLFLKSAIDKYAICEIPDISNCNFTISGRKYSINESIPNFSIIRVKCHNGFQIFPPFLDSITCNNGTYDKKIPYCVQCGQIRHLNVQDNSTDGVTVLEIPWQVEIYQNTTYKCGGTLINPRIIITNSLCFPDTIDEFQITVGKQNIDDSNLDNFTQKQIANRQQIKISDEIALIILKNPFVLNKSVHPVCIDWRDKFGYQEKTPSQPGIGISSKINDADKKDHINWIIQKFYDVDSSEVFLQPYEKTLLPNYFSAKTIEGPDTCLQDMGSGIAIKNKDGGYFLRGIFTSIANESLTFCTYIKVSYYLPFIKNVVENL